VLLRSCADASSAPGADARAIRGVGQQHPGGEEQGRLGGGFKSRWQPGLHVANSPEGQSPSPRGEDWEQCGNDVIAAVRTGLLHNHPRVAGETDPRLRSTWVVGEGLYV